MKKINKFILVFVIATILLTSALLYARDNYQDTRNEQSISELNKHDEPLLKSAKQDEIEKIRPYAKLMANALILMAAEHNSELSIQELAKFLTQTALKAMAQTDKYGKAFTPEELQSFTDITDNSYEGIGITTNQQIDWTPYEQVESLIDKSEKELINTPLNAIIDMIIIKPDGTKTNIDQNIPAGSTLIITKKHSEKTNCIIKDKYIKTIGYLEVAKTLYGSGAEKAGIKAGDIIVKIEGKPTNDLSIEKIMSMLRGIAGTNVTLSIKRNGNEGADIFNSLFEVSVRRQKIDINETTNDISVLKNNIGYIKITEFRKDISKTVKNALQKFNEQKVDKIIIDLRDNPGGELRETINILDYFTKKNTIFICTEYRNKIDQAMIGYEKPIFSGKMIVLIDKDSASASEILAGSLKSQGLAKILGEKSYGKGTVHSIFKFSNNDAISGMQFTIREYKIYDPREGRYIKIDGIGISPDIECDPRLPIEEILKLPEVKEYLK